MISILPLWTFHSYVATFQQYLHMEYTMYISQMLRYSRACGSYQDFLDRGLLLTRKLLNQGFLLVKLVITSNILRSPPWLGWPLWNICVINDRGYVSLVENTSRSFPHSWLITGFVTRLTRRVALMEQELLSLPGHLSSPLFFLGGEGGSYYSIFSSICMFCRSLFVLLYFSFGHCVVCFSSIYGFCLPFWYLQTLLPFDNIL